MGATDRSYKEKNMYLGNISKFQTFNVSISEPVKITIPPLSKEAMRASTVRFNCTASGRPAPSITWYKDGKLLELAGRVCIGYNENFLFFTNNENIDRMFPTLSILIRLLYKKR